MVRLSPTLKRGLALFLGAFALYALTAQRGLGWGDSGEFQYRIFTLGAEGVLKGCDSFATAHPLYIVLCKLLCSTPFQVTLVSSFFGAVAVALFYLLSRNFALAVLLALAHGLWWLSTVSEVYTLSLAFFAAELLALKRLRETGSPCALIALAAINGLHLELHNIALLALPVYVGVAADRLLRTRRSVLFVGALTWILFAGFWLWSFVALGPANVLWGGYGAQVLTLKPILPAAIPLNLALGALSLAVPLLLAARAAVRPGYFRRNAVWIALFAIHFLFWSTYFIVSQFTFVLPSLLLAGLLAREVELPWRRAALLSAVQVALPILLWGVLAAVGFPSEYRAQHPGRNDPAYFALPWHVTDDSADRAAALQRTPWKGYL